MKVGVAGGTGVLGQYIVSALEESGHAAVAMSRRTGVDLTTGSGLAAALDGVEVIVDAANGPSLSQNKATQFFTAATKHLHAAGAAAGVRRLVTISIVNIDQVTENPYYRAKLAHEQAALAGPLPVSIVRATQFHEFPAQVMLRSRFGPIVIMPHALSQTVSARALGAEVAAMAVCDEPPGRVDIAGPDVHDLVDLARAILRHRGSRAVVIAPPVPGAMGRKIRSGALTPAPGTARLVGPTFDEWLATGGLDGVPK